MRKKKGSNFYFRTLMHLVLDIWCFTMSMQMNSYYFLFQDSLVPGHTTRGVALKSDPCKSNFKADCYSLFCNMFYWIMSLITTERGNITSFCWKNYELSDEKALCPFLWASL